MSKSFCSSSASPSPTRSASTWAWRLSRWPIGTAQIQTFPTTIGVRARSRWCCRRSSGATSWRRFPAGRWRRSLVERSCCWSPSRSVRFWTSSRRSSRRSAIGRRWRVYVSCRACAKASFFHRLIRCWRNGWANVLQIVIKFCNLWLWVLKWLSSDWLITIFF